ncbi:hypothetical protein Tco_0436220 [Tanacetum coccineum]
MVIIDLTVVIGGRGGGFEAIIGRKEILEVKLDAKGVFSTEDAVSTDKEKVSTDRSKEYYQTRIKDEYQTRRKKARNATSTTPTTTPIMFGDDETISQVLLNMNQAKAVSREKEKGVKLKDKIEEEDESDTKSEDIPEAEKKFKQLARDEEMARKLQEDCKTEEERKRLAEEEATRHCPYNEYDFIQARMKLLVLIALRLHDEEREHFTVEERAKILHDTTQLKEISAEAKSYAIRQSLLQELSLGSK